MSRRNHRRLLRALEPALAHPRPPHRPPPAAPHRSFDFDRWRRACAAGLVEINASPERLTSTGAHPQPQAKGARFAISNRRAPPKQLDYMRYGVVHRAPRLLGPNDILKHAAAGRFAAALQSNYEKSLLPAKFTGASYSE